MTDEEKSKTMNDDFQYYSHLLDYNYKKYEKIYKLNRDLTIGSKKIISEVHRLSVSSVDEQQLQLVACDASLQKLRGTIISSIASEMEGEPYYKYSTAFRPGMEEYIEALLFYSYLKFGRILSFEEVQQFVALAASSSGIQQNEWNINNRTQSSNSTSMADVFEKDYFEHKIKEKTFEKKSDAAATNVKDTEENVCNLSRDQEISTENESSQYQQDNNTKTSLFQITPNYQTGHSLNNTKCLIKETDCHSTESESTTLIGKTEALIDEEQFQHCSTVLPLHARQLVSYTGYILGLGDVSGELMRYCIKSACAGGDALSKSAAVAECLRQMKAGYSTLPDSHITKNLGNKIKVHSQNLAKVENVLCDLNMRRGELTMLQPEDDGQMQQHLQLIAHDIE